MILTVTLNPVLEKRLYFDSVELGNSNRAFKEEFTAGGKGINVSRQLNCLGIQNSAFTFLGGNNGKIVRSLLTYEQIEFFSIATKSVTRYANLIIEKRTDRISTFFSPNAKITKEEATEFKNKLEKMIQNCSMVVFSGSSPCSETEEIFPYGIELANKHDKISILDTYGSHLDKCIASAPTVIHNNTHELENSLNISLKSEKDKIELLKKLYSKGIRLAFITDEAKPVYASKFDFVYKAIPPKVNLVDSTGSGDAFVAGLVYGLDNSLVFEETLKNATALGAANASMMKTCSVSKDEMIHFTELIEIETIGKKMKLIDDSPTTKEMGH
jgi:1-phosphofructokinase family hexose kinase